MDIYDYLKPLGDLGVWPINVKIDWDELNLSCVIGCDRNQSRDYLAKSSLVDLELAESLVIDYILNGNTKPIRAVELSEIRKKVLKLKEN